MHAGPYIKGQVEFAKASAAHYRREARIRRQEAEQYDQRAVECDAEAARWAAGTDAETVKGVGKS